MTGLLLARDALGSQLALRDLEGAGGHSLGLDPGAVHFGVAIQGIFAASREAKGATAVGRLACQHGPT